MQVDCQDFLSTSLMQIVSITRSKSSNIYLMCLNEANLLTNLHQACKIYNLDQVCSVSSCVLTQLKHILEMYFILFYEILCRIGSLSGKRWKTGVLFATIIQNHFSHFYSRFAFCWNKSIKFTIHNSVLPVQGTLPHGIDILTKADYYEVGKRKNTYLNLR